MADQWSVLGEWEDAGPGGKYCEYDVKLLSFPELRAAVVGGGCVIPSPPLGNGPPRST